MPRRRLHGETQKRRQKKRTRVLKLSESAARVSHTHRPMPYEASPELDAEDLAFLETMRDLAVRRMPGAGGLPGRRAAIEQKHFADEQQNAQAFDAAMSALGVRPLAEGIDPARPVAAGRRAAPVPGPTEVPEPQRVPEPAPRRRAEPPQPPTPGRAGTRFAIEPGDAALMEQALREEVDALNAKFQGAPPPAPRRKPRPPRDTEAAPDAELYLHGATQEQAIRRVQGFLLTSRRAKLRRVLIITGRGLNSGEQGPVLRDAVQRWLERNGGPYVREYSTAPARHGGEGALWVELK